MVSCFFLFFFHFLVSIENKLFDFLNNFKKNCIIYRNLLKIHLISKPFKYVTHINISPHYDLTLLFFTHFSTIAFFRDDIFTNRKNTPPAIISHYKNYSIRTSHLVLSINPTLSNMNTTVKPSMLSKFVHCYPPVFYPLSTPNP